MKKETSSKPVKKSKRVLTPKSYAETKVNDSSFSDDIVEHEENPVRSSSPAGSRRYVLAILALCIIVGAVVYKYQYFLIPAKVNGKPIFIWQYVSYLHKNYGKDSMQTLTTQAVIDQEIARDGIKVSGSEIQTEIDTIDKQASASGGISAMLASQQMTMDQLKEQLRIQLAVKKILKDKIAVSAVEVDDSYKKNKDVFKGVSEADARLRVRQQLEAQKFQKEAGNWLAGLKAKSTVQITFPGLGM